MQFLLRSQKLRLLMLYKNQTEIEIFYHHVIKNIANGPAANIQDSELKSIPEIEWEMEQTNPKLYALLEDFIEAYQQWYSVHVKIDKAGSAGNLAPAVVAELEAAITKRDATRQALLAAR
jgi:hypothetical protein